MRRFKRGSVKGVTSAWAHLLRLTSQGFFGELSLGARNVGKRMGRRVRLAARMFSPGLLFGKGTRVRGATVPRSSSPRTGAPVPSAPPLRVPVVPPSSKRPPHASPPR